MVTVSFELGIAGGTAVAAAKMTTHKARRRWKRDFIGN